MDMSERVILTNMCMVEDDAGNVLVEHRKGPHWPGVAFPGGHVEPGEAFAASVVREVREETGLEIDRLKLCGIRHFPKEDGTRYIVFHYKAKVCGGTLRPSEEGEVFWVSKECLSKYPLAKGFEEVYPLYFGETFVEDHWTKQDGVWQRELLREGEA